MMRSISCVVVLLVACAPVTREVYIDTTLPSVLFREPVASSPTFNAAPALRDGVLMLRISAFDRCAEITTPRKHRTTHIERHSNVKVMSGIWLVAALAAIAGVDSYTNPERVAAAQNQSDPMMMTTRADVRKAGIAELAISGVLAALAVGSHIRAIDSDRDDGVISDPPVRTEQPCNEHTPRDTRVVLELRGGVTLSGITDEQGVVEFDLSGVPGAALPQRKQPFTAAIGTARVSIVVADNEVAVLWSTLAARPQSRLAQERSAAPHQTADLLQAVCRSHDRGYELLYGAFTCLAPHVSNICVKGATAGIRFLVHRELKVLWANGARMARSAEWALFAALSELLVDQLIDQLVDQLIVPAASGYMKEACDLLVPEQLSRTPSDNIYLCALKVLQPQWTQDTCQPVGP